MPHRIRCVYQTGDSLKAIEKHQMLSIELSQMDKKKKTKQNFSSFHINLSSFFPLFTQFCRAVGKLMQKNTFTANENNMLSSTHREREIESAVAALEQ